jgi:hypothetical protein
MDGIATSANSRAALNSAEGNMQVTALKIAADADKAVVAVVEQAVEATKALPPPGQGRFVDKTA